MNITAILLAAFPVRTNPIARLVDENKAATQLLVSATEEAIKLPEDPRSAIIDGLVKR
jgi:hypothetical protein